MYVSMMNILLSQNGYHHISLLLTTFYKALPH